MLKCGTRKIQKEFRPVLCHVRCSCLYIPSNSQHKILILATNTHLRRTEQPCDCLLHCVSSLLYSMCIHIYQEPCVLIHVQATHPRVFVNFFFLYLPFFTDCAMSIKTIRLYLVYQLIDFFCRLH